MGHSSTWDISVAEIAVYGVLGPIILINLLRHRHIGRSGWVYMALFCLLQIAGSAMELAGSKYAQILLQVGLSPLLLALSGFSKEVVRAGKLNAPLVDNAFFSAGHHIIVMVGVSIAAYGAYGETTTPIKSNAFTFLKIGLVLLAIGLVVNFIMIGIVTMAYRRHRGPALLLIAAIISLPILTVRLLDSLVYAFSTGSTQTTFSMPEVGGNLTVYIVLQVLPGAIIAVMFALAGLVVPNERSSAPPQGGYKMDQGGYTPQAYYPGYNGPPQGGRMV